MKENAKLIVYYYMLAKFFFFFSFLIHGLVHVILVTVWITCLPDTPCRS